MGICDTTVINKSREHSAGWGQRAERKEDRQTVMLFANATLGQSVVEAVSPSAMRAAQRAGQRAGDTIELC